MTDNNGYVLSPLPVAPVNETDMVLLPDSLKALKRVAKMVGLDLRGAYLNLDAGFDSTHNRKCIFNAGMIPNITENPVGSKNSCGLARIVFQETSEAFTTPKTACVPSILADCREEEDVTLAWMIPLVMIMGCILCQDVL